MIRPAFTEVGIFLIPFAVYALFLVATRAGLLTPVSWPLHLIAKLAVVAMVLVVASFFVLAQLSGGPTNSTYVPAHTENGKLVPGTDR